MAVTFVLGLLLILTTQSYEESTTEGSGYDSTTPTTFEQDSTLFTLALATDIPVTNTNGTYILNLSFETIVNFLKEHMFPIIVIGSLVLLLVFIICTAVICSQKNKASAYYPSSFPKKKYVDEKDKIGGKKTLDEIPEKNSDAPSEEAISSTKQLEADILAATSNLKSPTKEQQMANGKETKLEIIDETATKNEVSEAAKNVPEEPCTEAGENKLCASQDIMMENLQLDKEKDTTEQQKTQDTSPAPENENVKEEVEANAPSTEAATSQSDQSTSDTQENIKDSTPSC
ncbi:transmembrane protein 119 [Protopterus annectens]|uniref:transmembrane protein 119 n=1 Tax=Protopterus annectens TaxID=7888 RepID=UPI001CFBE260|nr:transmembrane protein 119 [Protopterus annectens]XP_043924341.1 transmembrane protein 119 [Protopterus annectens]